MVPERTAGVTVKTNHPMQWPLHVSGQCEATCGCQISMKIRHVCAEDAHHISPSKNNIVNSHISEYFVLIPAAENRDKYAIQTV